MSPGPVSTPKPTARRPPRVIRIVRARPRLFIAAAVGALVTAALAWRSGFKLASFLVGWDVCVGLYLILAFEAMAGANAHQIRERAAEEDEGQFAVLAGTVAAALVSLAGIVFELAAAGGAASNAYWGKIAAGLAIFLSWAFIHTIFALHYAHEFYDREGGGGMAFPGGEEEPDYWDFVYFSFVIGMTSQVSDVGVTTKTVRRTVAAHGVVAFMFNTALLALSVGLAGNALQR